MTKKLIVYMTTIFTCCLTACMEKDYEVSETEKPTRLGGSIYEELSTNGKGKLEGTFTNYLKLVDELGYGETFRRTGSMTVFPANDDAFDQFFANNKWGVSSYDELSEQQKKQLLYNSMLDNALLTSMLSNVESGATSVQKGMALKHTTSGTIIDWMQHWDGSQVPQYGDTWDEFHTSGLDIVSDRTQPMMMHFTREYMLNKNITTDGDDSDFAFITGKAYSDGTAYIFRNEIIRPNVICMNGYIHQMNEVIVPPGNMAQVIRETDNMSLFSRMLDRFAAPYLSSKATQAYNNWAIQNGQPQKDAVYELRYYSRRSHAMADDKNDTEVEALNDNGNIPSNQLLRFDPGWNRYYPEGDMRGGTDLTIADAGTMFVPTDDALWQYFRPEGAGAYIIEAFGKQENTRDHLEENLDSIPQHIVATFVNNLMQPSMVDAVPSKFADIMNTASERLGMEKRYIQQLDDGRYDVKIANNGIIYALNEVLVPDEYRVVSAPTLFNADLSVMRWAIDDRTVFSDNKTTPSILGLDFWAYLLAMSANYAFFIPTDRAFDEYVVDPASLIDGQTPTALHFYTINESPFIACKRVAYDVTTQTFGAEYPEPLHDFKTVSTQMADILNTCTVILKNGEVLGQNHYYKTKQGAAICVLPQTESNDGAKVGWKINAQSEGCGTFATITHVDNEKNGHAYRLDRVPQSPTQSIYSVLKDNGQFSEFLELCEGFEAEELLDWLGFSRTATPPATKSEQEQLRIFSKVFQNFSDDSRKQVSIDFNLTLFNSYNYTVYAPDNTAMQQAYNRGLPHWQDVQNLFDTYAYHGTSGEQRAKEQALAMISVMHEFVCYHLQSDYVFADNIVPGGSYQTMQTNDQNMFYKLSVHGGSGSFTVTDGAGQEHTFSTVSGKMVNRLARDYQFAYETKDSHFPYLATSAYAVIHQTSEPFCLYANRRYDSGLQTRASRQHSIKRLTEKIKNLKH